MTALGNIPAGSRLTAAMLQGVAPVAAYKSAGQPVTSNATTLVNDSQLLLTLPANSVFIFNGLLTLTGAAIGAGDIRFTFSTPSGTTMAWEATGFSATTTGPLNGNAVRSGGGLVSVGISGATASPALLMGSISVGATGGPIQLQWCQNTSSTTATVVGAGSFLAAWQIQ